MAVVRGDPDSAITGGGELPGEAGAGNPGGGWSPGDFDDAGDFSVPGRGYRPLPGEAGPDAAVVQYDYGLAVRDEAVERLGDLRRQEERDNPLDAHVRDYEADQARLDAQEAALKAAVADAPMGGAKRRARGELTQFQLRRYGRIPSAGDDVDSVADLTRVDVGPALTKAARLGAANVPPELGAAGLSETGQTPLQSARAADFGEVNVQTLDFVPIVGTARYGMAASEGGFTKGELAMLVASGALDVVSFVPGGVLARGPAVAARATGKGLRATGQRLMIPGAGLADDYGTLGRAVDQPFEGYYSRRDLFEDATFYQPPQGEGLGARPGQVAYGEGRNIEFDINPRQPGQQAAVDDGPPSWLLDDDTPQAGYQQGGRPSIYYDPSKPSLDPLTGRPVDGGGSGGTGGGGVSTAQRVQTQELVDAVGAPGQAADDLTPEELRRLTDLRDRIRSRPDFQTGEWTREEWRDYIRQVYRGTNPDDPSYGRAQRYGQARSVAADPGWQYRPSGLLAPTSATATSPATDTATQTATDAATDTAVSQQQMTETTTATSPATAQETQTAQETATEPRTQPETAPGDKPATDAEKAQPGPQDAETGAPERKPGGGDTPPPKRGDGPPRRPPPDPDRPKRQRKGEQAAQPFRRRVEVRPQELAWEEDSEYRLRLATGEKTVRPLSDRGLETLRVTEVGTEPVEGEYQAGSFVFVSDRDGVTAESGTRTSTAGAPRRRKGQRKQDKGQSVKVTVR